MRSFALLLAVSTLVFGLAAMPHALVSRVSDASSFVHFESSHVHPAALTPDGSRLLVVNTPDDRLSVFDLTGPAPVRVAEIPVGMEPVSVAALDGQTAWVVNDLSDDVSVVDLGTMHVRATLRVGDEPSDVVFAGPGPKAYVSVSQEDVVRVFDPGTLALLKTIPIPGVIGRTFPVVRRSGPDSLSCEGSGWRWPSDTSHGRSSRSGSGAGRPTACTRPRSTRAGPSTTPW